jgi:hypothetical protein
MKPFHATNNPGTCLWCGHILRPDQYRRGHVGYEGNDHFCTLRCGFAFALAMAKNGKLFEPKPEPPTVERRKREKAPRCPECRQLMGNVTDYMHKVEVFRCGTKGCSYHVTQEPFTADGKLAKPEEIY